MFIRDVERDSPAWDAGLRPGSRIIRINDRKDPDLVDLYFFRDEPSEIEVGFDGRVTKYFLKVLSGIEVEGNYRSCQNRCFFCFVAGLPDNLRPSLYFKDDDYRLSFLFGNYISMTNLTDYDFNRIGRLNLSPLYISIHTTDPELRKELFGNEKAGMIREQLKRLSALRINFHTQIVVIPGYNDGRYLKRTIEDLIGFRPYLKSIALVPAGRTRYNQKKIAETTPEYARTLIQRFYDPGGFIQISDEYFLISGHPFPEPGYYQDFPQIENGCGMVAKLFEDLKGRPPIRSSPNDLYLITSRPPRWFLSPLTDYLGIPRDRVIEVKNSLFGPTVWVSGLLAGADVIKATDGIEGRFLIPPDTVNGRLFIDDVDIKDHPRFIPSPAEVDKLTELVRTL